MALRISRNPKKYSRPLRGVKIYDAVSHPFPRAHHPMQFRSRFPQALVPVPGGVEDLLQSVDVADRRDLRFHRAQSPAPAEGSSGCKAVW